MANTFRAIRIAVFVTTVCLFSDSAVTSPNDGIERPPVSDPALETAFAAQYADFMKTRATLQSLLTESQGKVSPERFQELDAARVKLKKRLSKIEPKLSACAEGIWLQQSAASPDAFR